MGGAGPSLARPEQRPLYDTHHDDASVLAVCVPVSREVSHGVVLIFTELGGRNRRRGAGRREEGASKGSIQSVFFPSPSTLSPLSPPRVLQTLQAFLLEAPAPAQLAWLHQLNVRIDAVLERVPATKVALTGEEKKRGARVVTKKKGPTAKHLPITFPSLSLSPFPPLSYY